MVCPTNIVIIDKETECNQTLVEDLIDKIGSYPKSTPPKFDLVFKDSNDVYIDEGKLYVNIGNTRPKEVNVSVRVVFSNPLTGGYSTKEQYIGVTIKFKDLCEDSECTDSQYCDPCTGKCEEGEVDINATIPNMGRVKLI